MWISILDIECCFKYSNIVFEKNLKVNTMISPKQKLIYDFIVSYSQEHGVAPSLEDIVEHFSDFLNYPSSAHYHVKKLQEEGYLERESNKPRSIGIYADRTVKTPFMKKTGMDSVRVPVLGAANAGPATLFAEENIAGYLKISRSKLNRKDGVFALRVEGDSMNRAKIDGKNLEEGDFVLIDSEYKTPKNGDHVLSIIDGAANLKKFERDTKTGDIKLISESSNPKHKPIYISSEDDFMINGRIISVIKR
jgi:repressor LexA